MRKIRIITLVLVALILTPYVCLCAWFYFKQEKALFNVVKVSNDHVYEFKDEFKELLIPVEDSIKLHGVLFKATGSKGLIL